MAKITTRPPEAKLDEAKLVLRLNEIIQEANDGRPIAFITVGNEAEALLDVIQLVLRAQARAGEQLFADLAACARDNLVLSMKLSGALDLLNTFLEVSYDDALDHATADLMDALASSGAAEITDDGDLSFDARVVMTKGDLKPALREAIIRWVDLKIQ
jgi:hypothetical protein